MTVPGSDGVNHAETGLVGRGWAGWPDVFSGASCCTSYVKDGRLRLVLTEWSPLEEGFHIYYSRRQLPTGLRLLIGVHTGGQAAGVVKQCLHTERCVIGFIALVAYSESLVAGSRR